jgi:hypothetical protein
MVSLFRSRCALVLGALAVACGGRTNLDGVAGASADDGGVSADDTGSAVDMGVSVDDEGATFPEGTYTRCAFGTVSSGPFLIPSGFDDGATLTVTQSGDARTATYLDTSDRNAAWRFTTTTSASAALAPSAQSNRGFGQSICVYGVGVSNEKFFPTNFNAASGAMTYESGAVFVSLQGELTSHTDCGDVSAPASVWIGCTVGPAPAVSAPAAAAAFPVGEYACRSQVGTHTTLDGKNAFISSGESGTLTLTQNGPKVTAQYVGGTELNGTLDFMLNAAGTASAVAGQSLTARCGLGPATDELHVAAASLTADDGTVFLSLAGTINGGSACPGGEKIATLVCAKK